MSREEAADQGIPHLVGHCDDVTGTTLISPGFPDYVEELLLGVPPSGAG